MSCLSRRAAASALAAVTLTLLAGCGSSSDNGGPEDASAKVITVTSIKTTPTLAFAPLLYAIEKGLFEDAGIRLEEKPDATTSTAPIQAMLAGQADVVWIGTSAVPAAQLAGKDVRCIGNHFAGNAYQLELNTKAVEKLAGQGITEASPIADRVAALKGLTIATNGSGNTVDSMLRATLGKFGVKENELQIRGIPDPAAMIAAAREGQVDGYMFVPPVTTTAVVGGYGKIWIDYTKDVAEWRAMPGGCLATTSTFIKNNPETLKRLLSALDKAYDEILGDPVAAKADLGKSAFFSQVDPALFSAGFDAVFPMFKVGPTPTEEGYKALLEIFNSDASLPKKSAATFADLFDADLIKSAN